MDNEDYLPIKPNVYNYISKNFSKNIHQQYITNQNINNKIYKTEELHICAYSVNNEGIYPFLQYLLVDDNNLSFPYIPVNNYKDININQIRQLVTLLLFSLTLTDSLEYFTEKISIDGFFEYKGQQYIFIDMSDIKFNLNDIYKGSPCRFVLIDEIVNLKHCCNFKLSNIVTDLFEHNYELCMLTDNNGDKYEIPSVYYVGRPNNTLNFTYVFGVSKKDKDAILGPFHYFTNYNGAIKELYDINNVIMKNQNINNSNNNNGIVRFAIFTKNMKIIENLPNDPYDTSDIKSKLMQNYTFNTNSERLTMRITDYDGNWANIYDSCYLGEVILDDGTIYNKTNILVVKEYIQQVPLSYHYVNYKLLSDKYNENKYYVIM